MGLTDDDVREILRIIDESQLDELRIEMEGFQLHVRRGGAAEGAD
jgi:acetyl-CoA carboxylase biotin carboxyl carrier protein